jgi:hypothetical protein
MSVVTEGVGMASGMAAETVVVVTVVVTEE